MSLTKINIINSIYDAIGIPKKDCIGIVESIFDIPESVAPNVLTSSNS